MKLIFDLFFIKILICDDLHLVQIVSYSSDQPSCSGSYVLNNTPIGELSRFFNTFEKSNHHEIKIWTCHYAQLFMEIHMNLTDFTITFIKYHKHLQNFSKISLSKKCQKLVSTFKDLLVLVSLR